MNLSDEEKRDCLEYLKWINEFLRDLEDFADENSIDIADDKIYIAAIAQRALLRKLLNIKKN